MFLKTVSTHYRNSIWEINDPSLQRTVTIKFEKMTLKQGRFERYPPPQKKMYAVVTVTV